MNKQSSNIIGGVLVVIGALFFLQQLGFSIFQYFDIGYLLGNFWPAIFLILPALIFHYAFFSGNRREPGLLVPGGILLVLGAAFQINMLFGGWDIMWPAYIFSVAFGLYELYYFGNRDKGLLVPVSILGGLSIVFFTTFSLRELFSINVNGYFIPAALIIIGLLIVFRRGGPNKGY